MKKLLLVLILFSSTVNAGSVQLSWINPTKTEDGSELSPEDITQTRLEYGTCNGNEFGELLGEVIKIGNAQTRMIKGLTFGETYCVRAYTKTDVESKASNVVAVVVKLEDTPTTTPTTKVPKAPSNLRQTK